MLRTLLLSTALLGPTLPQDAADITTVEDLEPRVFAGAIEAPKEDGE